MTDTTLITIGIISQSVPVVMVWVYMPLVNWWERKQEKAMESDIPDDEWYECEM